MNRQLELQLFGSVNLRVNGEPVELPGSQKSRWLLALLALRGGREVSRSWLAGTLWPEVEESRALFYLRRELTYLRRVFGTSSNRIQNGSASSLILALDDVEVDVVEFDRAIRNGDETSLRRAADLYVGPVLESCAED